MRRDVTAQLLVPRVAALTPCVAGLVPRLVRQEVAEKPLGATAPSSVLGLLRVVVGHILSLGLVPRASRLAAGPRSSGDRASVS